MTAGSHTADNRSGPYEDVKRWTSSIWKGWVNTYIPSIIYVAMHCNILSNGKNIEKIKHPGLKIFR